MWKDINGWENYYEINEFGEVRNKITGHILVGDKNSGGYSRVGLYAKGHIPDHQKYFRHRLVAQHFIPNPNNLPEVNHKDLNIDNNCASNLEWVDKKGNELHSRKYGSKKYNPVCITFKDGTKKYFDIRLDAAKEIGVSSGTIRNWAENKHRGYENYNIESVYYI